MSPDSSSVVAVRRSLQCLLAALLWFTHRHLQQLYRAHSSSDHNRLLASLSRHLGLWILLNWLTYALTT